MLKKWVTASALAGTLLMTTAVGVAQALPVFKPEVAKSEGVTLVGRDGRGGGGGGFAMRGGGGRGFAMPGGGGGGRGLSMQGGGGPRIGGFSGGGPRIYGGGDAPRYSGNTFRSLKGYSGGKFAGDFKDRHFRHKHRRFHGFASYGVLAGYASYGDYGYGCGWVYRRAIVTGSPYWWNRYYACREGYYDYY